MKIQLTLPTRSTRFSVQLGTLLLTTFALGAHGQTRSVRDLQPTDLRNVEALKSTTEITSELISNIEGFRPANLTLIAGRLRRVTIHRVMERGGRVFGEETSIIEPLTGWPGYYGVSLPTANDEKESMTREVNFLNFSTIAKIRRFISKTTYLFLGRPIHQYSHFITESTLPADFEAAMKPGATWSYEQTYESESSMRSATGDKKNGDISFKSISCKSGDEVTATAIHAKLDGNAVPIHCHVKNGVREDTHDYMYLKGYGFFIPVTSDHASLKQGGERFTQRYAVQDIEIEN